MLDTLSEVENTDNPEKEIRGQILWLERQIGLESGNLKIFSSELAGMEKDLNKFLAEYCKEVGALFEENKKIDRELNKRNLKLEEESVPEKEEVEEDFNFSFSNVVREKVVEKEVKRIYRKLAKVCHPDTFPEDPEAAEAFNMLRDSYAEKDLSALIGLEQALTNKKTNETLVEKLERMEKQYDSILNEADRLKVKRYDLENSPGYKLQQRACWHRMCGDNLIERIKKKVRKKIERKMILLDNKTAEEISSIVYITDKKKDIRTIGFSPL